MQRREAWAQAAANPFRRETDQGGANRHADPLPMVRFRWWTFQEETNMKRTVLLVAVAAGLVALACGGTAPTAVDQPATVAVTQDGGMVTASAGSGRTEIVRLPPLQATEWVADCGAF